MKTRTASLFIWSLFASLAALSRPSIKVEVLPAGKAPDAAFGQTAVHAAFGDSSVINGATVGLKGDGITDNTQAFHRLFAVEGKQVEIPPGNYVTGSFEIPSNTYLTLRPGAVIHDSGRLGPNERLVVIRGSHVRISATGARIVAERGGYSTGEQRHGVYIFGATDVYIQGLESSNHGGDGFYVGGPPNHPASNISLVRCRASDNRRQGLSITNARNVDVVDSTFSYTSGTAPQFGIDIEPNRPTDEVNRIHIVRPRTVANKGGGIAIYLARLNPGSPPVEIAILDHTSQSENRQLYIRKTEGARGSIRYAKSAPTK